MVTLYSWGPPGLYPTMLAWGEGNVWPGPNPGSQTYRALGSILATASHLSSSTLGRRVEGTISSGNELKPSMHLWLLPIQQIILTSFDWCFNSLSSPPCTNLLSLIPLSSASLSLRFSSGPAINSICYWLWSFLCGREEECHEFYFAGCLPAGYFCSRTKCQQRARALSLRHTAISSNSVPHGSETPWFPFCLFVCFFSFTLSFLSEGGFLHIKVDWSP